MTLFPAFDDDDGDRPSQAVRLAPKLQALAAKGVYFGGSSWKYPGWIGSIYSPHRYLTRGKFSQAKFDSQCLNEYAQTFPVVCGDFAFYQFPKPDFWRKLFGDSPSSLSFAFKVPEEITVAHWPGHARYGVRAGEPNSGFLDATLFRELFSDRLAPYAERVAPLIFEFGTFSKSTFPTPGDFLARLDGFLRELPREWRYSVEIRNPEYLGSDYFGLLKSHNVAHVFNAWTRMPDLAEQVDMDGAFTADFTVARALLKRGRGYDQAVQTFQPYEKVQEVVPGARAGMVRIVERTVSRMKPAYLFVNNRLEGNAPSTIEAVIGEVESLLGPA